MEGGAEARALVPPAPQQAAMTANWLDQCARAHYACGDVVTAADISHRAGQVAGAARGRPFRQASQARCEACAGLLLGGATASAAEGAGDAVRWAASKEGREQAAKAGASTYSAVSGGVRYVSAAIQRARGAFSSSGASKGAAGAAKTAEGAPQQSGWSDWLTSRAATAAATAAADAAKQVTANASSTIHSSLWSVVGKFAGFAIVLVAVGGFTYGLGSAAPRLLLDLVRSQGGLFRKKKKQEGGANGDDDGDGDAAAALRERAAEAAAQAKESAGAAAAKARAAASAAWERVRDGRQSDGAAAAESGGAEGAGAPSSAAGGLRGAFARAKDAARRAAGRESSD
ncbi:hypothetical protein FNF29_00250 [Cafeteria roenbergensis]|uniref:Uncharacterized protein n=1 Tax=Cafeteria roenbergensis TaxID=33653 RepID=A0A5A8CXN2_CAFRO|nr:hypothetical protein FNF29_00250 [Cafeteria roenbergensis]|eukprot:KAA0157675.1 hypothetical protein FNF29_00250 [Cafeteria roenbergensis]